MFTICVTLHLSAEKAVRVRHEKWIDTVDQDPVRNSNAMEIVRALSEMNRMKRIILVAARGEGKPSGFEKMKTVQRQTQNASRDYAV